MSTIRIRVSRGDAAYLYQLLESYEGLTAYSTLEGDKSASFRDIELAFPAKQSSDLKSVLGKIAEEIPLKELDSFPSAELVQGQSTTNACV